MDPKDEFVNFLQEKPAYYPIIQSPLILDVLRYLAENAKPISEIYSSFSFMEVKDLDEVLDLLDKLRLIQKVKGTSTLIYYATEDAKILLEKYKKAKNYMVE
jgi:predicted transcriptional regulator